MHLTCAATGHPVAGTTFSGQRVRQPLYSTALQRYPRTVASKHYHQRKIPLRQRSPSLAEYAKGRLAWAAACQASTASV
jgi:hypothetical protein